MQTYTYENTYIFKHTHMKTHTYANTHICKHTNMQRHTYAKARTYKHTHLQTHTYSNTHIWKHIHMQTRICKHKYMQTHKYANTHMQTQIYANTRICNHTHVQVQVLLEKVYLKKKKFKSVKKKNALPKARWKGCEARSKPSALHSLLDISLQEMVNQILQKIWYATEGKEGARAIKPCWQRQTSYLCSDGANLLSPVVIMAFSGRDGWGGW